MKQIPLLLTHSRALLVPCVVLLAHSDAAPWSFVLCLSWAFLSDIFDGVIARRLGVDTPQLRQLDTIVDTVFYLAVLYAIWVLHPSVVATHALGLWGILGLEVLGYLASKMKFGRGASHHAWSAKGFGLALFVACTCLLGFGISGWVFLGAIVVGWICELESLAMTLVLPIWRRDTRHLGAALRIRKAHRLDQTSE